MGTKAKEHAFSIELKSKDSVKLATLAKDPKSEFLVEGFLGELLVLNFLENALLEIEGANGTLRIDLSEEDLKKLLQHKNTEVKR